MVLKICNKPYPESSDFDSHFEKYGFPLSDFQKYAIQGIIEKNHVLVTAHTGSGKTLPAEFAIEHLVGQGKKVVYTSPIKALSNQKFAEFTRKYPHISFGLLTGDIKTNPEADVLIMTTEILMNYLFIQTTSDKENKDETQLHFQIDLETELGAVIFDEVHYINDHDRGQTWEKTILKLPPHVQMVMLSATIDKP
jgi:antiviral helicase SKI2